MALGRTRWQASLVQLFQGRVCGRGGCQWGPGRLDRGAAWQPQPHCELGLLSTVARPHWTPAVRLTGLSGEVVQAEAVPLWLGSLGWPSVVEQAVFLLPSLLPLPIPVGGQAPRAAPI